MWGWQTRPLAHPGWIALGGLALCGSVEGREGVAGASGGVNEEPVAAAHARLTSRGGSSSLFPPPGLRSDPRAPGSHPGASGGPWSRPLCGQRVTGRGGAGAERERKEGARRGRSPFRSFALTTRLVSFSSLLPSLSSPRRSPHGLPVQPRRRRHQNPAPHHAAHEVQQCVRAARLLPRHGGRGRWPR